MWFYEFFICFNFWILFIYIKGGMFVLGVKYFDNEEKYLNLGVGIFNICYELYVRLGI